MVGAVLMVVQELSGDEDVSVGRRRGPVTGGAPGTARREDRAPRDRTGGSVVLHGEHLELLVSRYDGMARRVDGDEVGPGVCQGLGSPEHGAVGAGIFQNVGSESE